MTVSVELLHGAFERQANNTPDRIAISLAGRSLTYRQIYLRVQALAVELLTHGAGPGAVIGVCAERTPELVVALLAVLKTGAAYLPLDPSNPIERIAFLLGDAKPLLLLADAPARARLGAHGHDVLTLALEREARTAEMRQSSPHFRSPDQYDLAYVIYTSGSTGHPKGVMCTHRGIVNRLKWMQERYKLDASDGVLHKTSIGFDVSLWELFWPLSVGARLVLARPDDQRHPEALAHTIRAEGVTVVHFVPTMLMSFMSAGQLEHCDHLRTVICSGETLPGHVRDLFLESSKADLHNLYGPTEASVDVTHHTCKPEFTTTVPIGRAIKRVEVHVLDERLNPVPDGKVGEICVGGVALARGYLGHPGLTAERFVPDPRGSGARLYRTGDHGRVREDGELEFIGRRDDQVKIRGVRVELGEVEAALTALPGVERCVIVLADGDHPCLVAYVVGTSSSEYLRAELARRLPAQAVPSRFVYLNAIPTLASGKVNRRALSTLDPPGAGAAREDADRPVEVLPRTDIELALARIWRIVLGVHSVGVDDNFFVLGGDSIRSIEVVARARAAGLGLTTPDIFAHQTLRELARHVCIVAPSVHSLDDAATTQFALIDQRDRRLMPSGVCDAMPLSSLLAGLLTESLENPNYLAYTTTLSLEGPYDPPALHMALAALVSRHPALRTAVEIKRFSEPLQLVYQTVHVVVSEVDARGQSGYAWRHSLDEWLACERSMRFEWSQPPLLRVTVHRRDAGYWQLTLTEPFLDGWSATLALAELLSLYTSHLRGQRPTILPAPRASNRDLLVGERAALRAPEQRAFWKAYLTNAPATRLPRLAPSSAGLERHLGVAVPIPEAVAYDLGQLARDLRVPLKSVLLAAHAWVLAALVGQREVVCGLMVNGRPEGPDGELAIGLFLNTLPLRLRVEPGSWSQLIHAVHAAEAEVLPWRHYPYARILRESGRQTLFDSVVNFTHFHPYAIFAKGEADARVKLLDVEGSDQTYFPLTIQFSLDPSGRRVRLVLEVNPDGFTEPQVEQFVELHTNALTAMLDRVKAPHHTESLACRRERSRRASSRALERSSQNLVRLEKLFEQQVDMTPEAIAVFDDREQLTYECLTTRAHQVAHIIREHNNNAAPQRVGVCMRRSPALLVTVLASLMLGAAFVPLDPAMPSERLDAMISDAALDLVVADAASSEAVAGASAASRLAQPLEIETSWVAARAELATLREAGSPDDPAYIIYTSGSTGRPKGVLTPHLAVVNRLRWMWNTYPFRTGDVVCARGSIGFVDSVTEIFNGLLCGVPTYLLADEIREPNAFARAIGAAGVTRLSLVPALLRELLAGCNAEHRAVFARINHWVLSGEPLSGALVTELRRAAPRATVLNLYGSTEVAGDVTVYECGKREHDTVPAGTTIEGAHVRVVDWNGRDTPSGTLGEIVVEGLALAIGYLGDPGMTAERFRPSPLGVGQRLFRTGDLGRYRPDGILEVVGRRDRQVKINGVRVEPAEIEAVLLSHPLVRACAVVATQVSGETGGLLVAHVEVSRTGVESTELRSFLRERLPSAMVPGTVLLSTALPRTASGKIELQRLPTKPAVSRRAPRAPRTAVERAVTELAAVELDAETLTLEDDFFECGGDSLAALRLLVRLQKSFEVRLTLRDIFDHPTLRELCGRIELMLSQRQASA